LPLLEIIWGSEVMRRLWKMMENAAFLIGDAVAYAAWLEEEDSSRIG
jgi:hypothetical protein